MILSVTINPQLTVTVVVLNFFIFRFFFTVISVYYIQIFSLLYDDHDDYNDDGDDDCNEQFCAECLSKKRL